MRLVVLVSGSGRNLQALLEHAAAGRLGASIAAVISNRAEAPALQRARAAGVPALCLPHGDYPSRQAFDAALAEVIDRFEPQLLAMAGFMRVLGRDFVERFEGRMLNIHPSLLPRHPGLDTHQKVLDAAEPEHGATVHFVTPEVDGGPPVIQGRIGVPPRCTAATLGDKVMREVELRIYPQAVAWFARGALVLRQGRVWFRGVPLVEPLGLDDLEEPFR